MRTFYIFLINKDFRTLTKDNPYNLYKALESIYYFESSDVDLGMNIFEQVAVPFNKRDINKFIFNNYKENDFYMNFKNSHKIFNKYKDEKLYIKTNLTHIYLRTNISDKYIFENINMSNNLFVCDFKNKDYFWLDKILSLSSC